MRKFQEMCQEEFGKIELMARGGQKIVFDGVHNSYGETVIKLYFQEIYLDRATLWNAVENCEKHPKAQLAKYSIFFTLYNIFNSPLLKSVAIVK